MEVEPEEPELPVWPDIPDRVDFAILEFRFGPSESEILFASPSLFGLCSRYIGTTSIVSDSLFSIYKWPMPGKTRIRDREIKTVTVGIWKMDDDSVRQSEVCPVNPDHRTVLALEESGHVPT